MYRMEGGKAFTQALQNVADLVPLPFLSSFVGVGIKVLQACQDASTIEETVKDLQERVYGVVLEVVNSTVASNDESSVELRGGIENLQSVLAALKKFQLGSQLRVETSQLRIETK
ncbi:hypothetical protein MSAN_00525400 [Mycena sanguinolenta]|uniref:Uncharacterized protein n=1 Tax=Mycena sanguinolenta TaxID=230812 RepID=A0A8H6Z5Y2_9AGAR|nr:hypothetical protein MSAN_00525400 [Mycena sanguinolenta]